VNGANGNLKRKKTRTKRTNSFSFNKSDDIAIFSLNTFDLNFHEYDSIMTGGFKEIESQGINNLIIDIRKNSGGNSNFIVPLMDYLTDKPYYQVSKSEVKTSEAAMKCFTTNPIFINAIKQARKAEKESKKIDTLVDCYLNKPNGTLTSIEQTEEIPTKDKGNRFSGQLFVLTSQSTFSAATGFASLIKDYSLGSIIGEETSDNPTDYGSIILFDLPNSKVTIQNSTEYTVRPAGFDDEHGVLPDYLINRTYSDLISGYDRVMDYTFWMIKNNYHTSNSPPR
jgi:C-terminal processing protease CtpA/Prc